MRFPWFTLTAASLHAIISCSRSAIQLALHSILRFVLEERAGGGLCLPTACISFHLDGPSQGTDTGFGPHPARLFSFLSRSTHSAGHLGDRAVGAPLRAAATSRYLYYLVSVL